MGSDSESEESLATARPTLLFEAAVQPMVPMTDIVPHVPHGLGKTVFNEKKKDAPDSTNFLLPAPVSDAQPTPDTTTALTVAPPPPVVVPHGLELNVINKKKRDAPDSTYFLLPEPKTPLQPQVPDVQPSFGIASREETTLAIRIPELEAFVPAITSPSLSTPESTTELTFAPPPRAAAVKREKPTTPEDNIPREESEPKRNKADNDDSEIEIESEHEAHPSKNLFDGIWNVGTNPFDSNSI